MYRIGGRLGNRGVSFCGVTLGIPPLNHWTSNTRPLSGWWTLPGGQFDWGGRLPKCNGGVLRFPQDGWKSSKERKGRRELNCETDMSSRYESRT